MLLSLRQQNQQATNSLLTAWDHTLFFYKKSILKRSILKTKILGNRSQIKLTPLNKLFNKSAIIGICIPLYLIKPMRQSQQQKVGSDTTPQSPYLWEIQCLNLYKKITTMFIHLKHGSINHLRVYINIFNKFNYILMGSQYPNSNNNIIRTKFKRNTMWPHLEPCNLPHVCCNTTFLFFHNFTCFSLFYYLFSHLLLCCNGMLLCANNRFFYFLWL